MTLDCNSHQVGDQYALRKALKVIDDIELLRTVDDLESSMQTGRRFSSTQLILVDGLLSKQI